MRDGWVETTLGEVARTRPPAGVAAPGIPYVALEHFDSGDPDLHRWGDTADATSATTPFEPGDVLFGKLRPYLRKVVVAEFSGRCTNEALAYRVSSPTLSQEYLALLLRSDAALSHASVTTGTRMPRTSARSMASMRVLLPSIEEQRRIVALMNHMDSHAGALRAELNAVSEAHLAWLASLNARADAEKWVRQPLAQFTEGTGKIQTGPFGSQLHRSDYVADGEIPVVMPANMSDWAVNLDGIARITSSMAEPLSRHLLREGDIAWARRGDVTRFAVIDHESAGALCGTGCFLIRPPDPGAASWLHTWLKTPSVASYLLVSAVGGTMDNLNAGILGAISVAIPPPAVIEDLSQLGRSTESHQQALKKEIAFLKEVRSAVLSSLLAGKHQIPTSYDEFIRDEEVA